MLSPNPPNKKMLQPTLFGMLLKKPQYFKNPKSEYDKFVNKHWLTSNMNKADFEQNVKIKWSQHKENRQSENSESVDDPPEDDTVPIVKHLLNILAKEVMMIG